MLMTLSSRGRNGLLVLTGSQAALGPTPYMIGYGCAKAAVHQIGASLAGPSSGLPAGTHVVVIRPLRHKPEMMHPDTLMTPHC